MSRTSEKIGDSAEVVVAARAADGMTLWGTDNPAEVIKRASKVASVLADVVDKKKMFTMIGQGKHLRVEAWQTLGALTGVFPVTAWTRKLDNGWEARVEARTKNGELVGAAECECLNTERNWANKEDHSLRSMAQTRAVSKALSMPLRFIVALAGYEGTPAEEMPSSGSGPAEARPSDAFRPPRQTTAKSAEAETPAPAGAKPTPATAAAATESALKTWTGKIDKVTWREYQKKDRQTGKPTGETGKTFSILGKDGKTFKTWSETFAKDCKFASENDEEMTIKYTESKFRDQIEFKAEECFPTGADPSAGDDETASTVSAEEGEE